MEVIGNDGKQYTIEPGADLSGADLSRADLNDTSLTGADLSGALLIEADLSDAILIDANLSEADLSQVNLSGAILSGANLSGANLSRADLSGANLSGVNLEGVTYDGQTVFPVGFDPPAPPDPPRVPSTSSPLTGIGLLRVLAWICLVFSPIGGFVLGEELGDTFGLQLFITATLSGLVTFAVFLVLCTIAENLIAIKNAVTSNTQQSS